MAVLCTGSHNSVCSYVFFVLPISTSKCVLAITEPHLEGHEKSTPFAKKHDAGVYSGITAPIRDEKGGHSARLIVHRNCRSCGVPGRAEQAGRDPSLLLTRRSTGRHSLAKHNSLKLLLLLLLLLLIIIMMIIIMMIIMIPAAPQPKKK